MVFLVLALQLATGFFDIKVGKLNVILVLTNAAEELNALAWSIPHPYFLKNFFEIFRELKKTFHDIVSFDCFKGEAPARVRPGRPSFK